MARQKDKDGLIDAKIQARWFSKVREAHQMETAEDYVELIADLIEANGEARPVDLVERFGVSHTTVHKVLERLQREGFVSRQPYRSLFLTDAGKDLAARCKKRHDIVLEFLLALGVSRKNAESDAEGVEHHVSAETLEIFENFIRKSTK